MFGAAGAVAWICKSAPLDGAADADGSSPGLARALRYVESLGEAPGGPEAPPSDRFGRREAMRSGMQGIRQEERVLTRQLLAGLSRMPGIRVLGEDDPARAALRTPAVTFVPEDEAAAALADGLRADGAEVGSGDLGSAETLEALGADPESGAVRASLAHYHTRAAVDEFLGRLRRLV